MVKDMTTNNAETPSNGFDCSGAKDGADANDSGVRETERREFWKACVVSLLSVSELSWESTIAITEDALKRFDERWK